MKTKQIFIVAAIITAFGVATMVTPALAQNVTGGNATTAGGNVTGGNATTAATVGPVTSEGGGEEEEYEK
jgi:hypothetical protein